MWNTSTIGQIAEKYQAKSREGGSLDGVQYLRWY